MHPEAPPDAAGRSRWFAGCLISAVVAGILLVVVSLLAILSWSSRSARRVKELTAAIRAQSEPVSAEDLELMYVIPAGKEDTTAIWLNAVAGLESAEFKQASSGLPIVGENVSPIPPPGQPWPQLAAAEELLQQHQANMRGLHEAAAHGGTARYPVKFEDGLSALLPHAQSLRAGARMLVLEAHVHAHRGDAHAAAESIHALDRLAGSLEQEPLLISQLVRIAIGGISSSLCCDLLPDVEFSEEDLLRMGEEYRTRRYATGHHRALLGERVMGITAFENPQTLGKPLPAPVNWIRNDDLGLYLELMELAIAASQKPYFHARPEYRSISQRMEAVLGGGPNKFRYVRTALLVPGLDAVAVAAARGDFGGDAAATAIAIERYRRRHHAWPERLDELVPEFLPQVPTDPFDGRPVRYVVQPDKYLLYSVGRDGVDNGGQGEQEPDIVFTVKQCKLASRTRSEP
jgi:hypothetical protein